MDPPLVWISLGSVARGPKSSTCSQRENNGPGLGARPRFVIWFSRLARQELSPEELAPIAHKPLGDAMGIRYMGFLRVPNGLVRETKCTTIC